MRAKCEGKKLVGSMSMLTHNVKRNYPKGVVRFGAYAILDT